MEFLWRTTCFYGPFLLSCQIPHSHVVVFLTPDVWTAGWRQQRCLGCETSIAAGKGGTTGVYGREWVNGCPFDAITGLCFSFYIFIYLFLQIDIAYFYNNISRKKRDPYLIYLIIMSLYIYILCGGPEIHCTFHIQNVRFIKPLHNTKSTTGKSCSETCC